MTRSVFYGFGAYVGSLTGRTSCGYWPDDPDQYGWDPQALISVDLGKNPEAARRGLIAITEIQCDDYAGYAFDGLTQVGPMWPGGRMNGSVWLESEYWKGLGARQPSRTVPGLRGRPYELVSILYWDTPLAGRRFNGIYGEIKQQAGNRALVALWERGTSQAPGKQPFGTFWLDMSKDVLPPEPDYGEVSIAGAQKGALFVDAKVLNAMSAPLIKIPPGLGGAVAPRKMRRA